MAEELTEDDILQLALKTELTCQCLKAKDEALGVCRACLFNVLADYAKAMSNKVSALTSFFSEAEIKAFEEDPDALRSLAEWHSAQETMHSAQETMADAMGYAESAQHHMERRLTLNMLAQKIEESY